MPTRPPRTWPGIGLPGAHRPGLSTPAFPTWVPLRGRTPQPCQKPRRLASSPSATPVPLPSAGLPRVAVHPRPRSTFSRPGRHWPTPKPPLSIFPPALAPTGGRRSSMPSTKRSRRDGSASGSNGPHSTPSAATSAERPAAAFPKQPAREEEARARLQQLVDRETSRLERVIGDLDATVIRVDGDCRRARQRWDHLTDFRGVVNGTAHQSGRHLHRLRDGLDRLDQRPDGHPGCQIDNQPSPTAPQAPQPPERDSPSL